ncbi:MAG TPA: UDP-N-acetylmuramate--L-alanine ligase [Chitinophagaceae bacterium]|nr:UDP-N-acetylmuramate--L-alanine ligase [Chitinophagaceae bacterium]
MNAPFGGLDKIREVYFIGIGGIGMSAIARFFHAKGVKVSGYDKTKTALTAELEANGIAVHYEEDVEMIPKQADLVVYTPAIPSEHKELTYYQQHGHKVVKRSDVLQLISEGSFNICIAGTHGKTTITTMIAHLLRDSGFGCNAFLGGISVNYGTNFWSDPRNVCVIEADEYDRSFLKLNPDIAIISAMDADHLDIYGTAAAVEQAFIDFSKKVKPGGTLISHAGLPRGKELKADSRLTYSLQDENADAFGGNIRMNNGSYWFDVKVKDVIIRDVKLNMGGMHNIENAIAAITVASSLGIEKEKIRSAVASFKGVKRRFEYVVKTSKMVYVDDYAHHPEELKALISGAKKLFTGQKCTVIFQPHLFSRTRDFAKGFAEVLNQADEVFLLPIYPARERPIEGVTSEMLVSKMPAGKARVVSKEEMMSILEKRKQQQETMGLLITAGAGDIDTLVPMIKKLLNEK